jgi:exodeoxyribonuclease V beta subunit
VAFWNVEQSLPDQHEEQSQQVSWPEALAQLTHSKDSELLLIEEGSVQIPVSQTTINSEARVLVAQSFTGHIDANNNLLSYSALVRQLSYGSQAQQTSVKDRGDGSSQLIERSIGHSQNQSQEGIAVDELRFTLAKGKNTGLLLHDILEQVDFSQPSWPSAMEVPLTKYHTMVGIDEDDTNKVERLQQWLEECLAAVMPPIVRIDADVGANAPSINESGITLSQLSQQQTLREAEFYFPLQQAKQSTLAKILSRHRGGLATALPSHPILQGMMHGFIDLIFEHEGRFFVADYKSNYLGDSLADYSYQSMLEANQSHYYDLQYLIYSLALHRYLGQRMPNYDPTLHFGGVYYLYLRGMSPKADSGVFATVISIEELSELDHLFAGETI